LIGKKRKIQFCWWTCFSKMFGSIWIYMVTQNRHYCFCGYYCFSRRNGW